LIRRDTPSNSSASLPSLPPSLPPLLPPHTQRQSRVRSGFIPCFVILGNGGRKGGFHHHAGTARGREEEREGGSEGVRGGTLRVLVCLTRFLTLPPSQTWTINKQRAAIEVGILVLFLAAEIGWWHVRVEGGEGGREGRREGGRAGGTKGAI